MQYISIRGARTHNLRNIDLDLPRDRLIVITGLSGSGKSSLAFDTIYAEGQRRYVESLSAYARQFLSMMDKPDVDHIEGLSPAISIEQKTASHNPRSTVGTVTEIYDYLRLLFARAGTPRCPDHGRDLEAQTVSQMVDQVLSPARGHAAACCWRPVVPARKGEHTAAAGRPARPGLRARPHRRRRSANWTTRRSWTCATQAHHRGGRGPLQGAATTSRSGWPSPSRPRCSSPTASATVAPMDGRRAAHARRRSIFSDRFACPICGYSIAELEPRLFSFNNPAGACAACDGLGVKQFFDPDRVVRTRPVAWPAARSAAGTGATPTISDDPEPGEALRIRHRGAVERSCRRRSSKIAAPRQRRGRRSSSTTSPRGTASASAASTRSRASCRTWSAATGRPNPARCARNWPST